MQGGRVATQQIATDAFGNALGYSLAGGSMAASSGVTPPPSQGVGPWSETGYRNGADVESDAAGGAFPGSEEPSWARVNGLTFSQDAALRRHANNPYGLPTQSTGQVIRDFDPDRPDGLLSGH